MKRWAIVAVMACAAILPAIAEITPFDTISISAMIDDGLELNYDSIKAGARLLPKDQRTMLYQSHRKEVGAAGALNFFLGYGIGSFTAGDPAAPAFLIADLAATAFFVVSSTYTSRGLGWYALGYSGAEELAIGKGLLYTGTALALVSRLSSIGSPRKHVERYNDDLKSALGLYDFSIEPSFTDHLELAAAFTFEL